MKTKNGKKAFEFFFYESRYQILFIDQDLFPLFFFHSIDATNYNISLHCCMQVFIPLFTRSPTPNKQVNHK